MQLSHNISNNILTLEISGRIDSITSSQFEDYLLSLIDEKNNQVVISFENIEFISSSGLRVLLLAAKKLKSCDGQLVITKMKPDVREVFDVTGFSLIFHIYESQETALLHFAS